MSYKGKNTHINLTNLRQVTFEVLTPTFVKISVFSGLMLAVWLITMNVSEEASWLKREAAASSGTKVPAYQKCIQMQSNQRFHSNTSFM
jgi:hypothetical protein